MSKNQLKRFQRSYCLTNTPIGTQSFPQLPIELKQFDRQRDISVKNYSNLVEGNSVSILARLAQLESMIEMEKLQRLRDQGKMKNMIKEMECKHTSIIYDSQIRYCKSPPKPDRFFTNNFKNKENTLLKSSSVSILNRQKENLSQLNLRANKAIIARCVDKVENYHQISKQSQLNYRYQNPESNIQPLQKNQNQITQKNLTQEILKKVSDEMEKIQQNFTKKLDIVRKELASKITIHQEYFDQKLLMFGIQQENKSTNLNTTIDHLNHKLKELQSQNMLISQNLRNLSKESQNKTKEIVLLIKSESQERMRKIEQTFAQFKDPFKSKLQVLCEILEQQNIQIKKMDEFCGLNHKIYTNKIQQIFQFLNNKLNFYEKQQRQKNQNHLKQNEAEKQKQRQAIIVSIEQSINNKSDLSKIRLDKHLQDRCQRIEDVLMGVVERHIHYIQEYIRKNIEKENTIMKNYSDIYNGR